MEDRQQHSAFMGIGQDESMAVYCKSCIAEICDFCKWFDFNGDEYGCYTDNGWCRRHAAPVDLESSCPAFHCRNATEGNQFSTLQRG